MFLLPEKYILFERLKKKNSPCDYDKEKKVLKQCQSNGSTNHVERGVVTRRLNKCDWMAIS